MAFNNYLEDENDKPYFTTNSLAYYYDKMEGFAKAVEGSAKALNLTKEEVEKRLTLYIEQNKNELDQRLADWDGKLETFDSSVETLLTEWVDDGTLTPLIDSTLIDRKIAPVTALLAEKAEKAYVDNLTASLASGSPKGAYATLAALQTAFPTGNSNIYVVTADGKWYYWNSSAWSAGGVYQGQKLSTSDLQIVTDETLIKTVEYESRERLHLKKINKAGNVKAGTWTTDSIVRGTLQYIDNDEVIFSKEEIPKIMRFQRVEGEINYPYFTKAVSTNTSSILGFWLKKTDIQVLPDSVRISPQVGIVDASTTILGDIRATKAQALAVGTKLNAVVGTSSMEFETVKEYRGWLYYTVKVGSITGQTGTRFVLRLLDLTAGNSGKLDILNYTIIDGSEILPHTVYPANTAEIPKTSFELEQQFNSKLDGFVVGGTSKLNGKIWNVIGDSNSRPGSAKKYHQFIKEKVAVTVNSYAVGGAGYMGDGSLPDSIMHKQIELSNPAADIVTIFAGGNDYSGSQPIGTIGDTTLDTFYGSVDYTLSKAIEKFPLKTIAVLIQTRRASETNSAGIKVEDHANATIDVCEKYGIPYLDLFHAGNVYPWNPMYREQCMPDGVHLSDLGQQKIAEKILSFMETL